jgi:DNA-binding transcriptional MerR regulator
MTSDYTIQQAADETSVTAHTLRFYERIGLLRDVARATNGHRRYSDADLGWVRFVLLLRDTGMPLSQILAFMALEKDGPATVGKRLSMLGDHRGELVRHIAELQGSLAALDAKITYYQAPADVCDGVAAR